MKFEGSILLATNNPHKLSEIGVVFGAVGIEVESLIDIGGDIEEPVEDQLTFAGNALLKARYYSLATGLVCLADDSGLEVDALGGAPGVYSARYAGVEGERRVVDRANNAKLIDELRKVGGSGWSGRFVCCMALCDGEGVLAEVRGEIEGILLTEPMGENGFGYDPYFYVPDRGCTTAQLSQNEKNAISHRGVASRLMIEKLVGLRG